MTTLFYQISKEHRFIPNFEHFVVKHSDPAEGEPLQPRTLTGWFSSSSCLFLTFLLQGGDVAHPDAARHFTEQFHRVRNCLETERIEDNDYFLSSCCAFVFWFSDWRIGATYSSSHETTIIHTTIVQNRRCKQTSTPCQSCLLLDWLCVSVHTPVIRHNTSVCGRSPRPKRRRSTRDMKLSELKLKMWPHGTFCPQSNDFPCFPGWSTRIRTTQKTLCSRRSSFLEPSES